MPIDFFRVDPDASLPNVLPDLLSGGLSPISARSVRLPFVEPHVAKQWQDGVHNSDYAGAVSRLLTNCAVTTLWTSGQVASTLQQAAAVPMSLGQISLANRCLQDAIVHLANGGPPGSAESDLQRWALLSAVALSKKESDSARLWLRQASRTLTGNASELSDHAKTHSLGDLLALQACLLGDAGDIHSAVGTLQEAMRLHQQAGSIYSVVTDQILVSRCLRRELLSVTPSRQPLIDAVHLLRTSPSHHEKHLAEYQLGILQSDLKLIADSVTPKQLAVWN